MSIHNLSSSQTEDAEIPEEEQEDDSMCMVQKWLENSESMNSEDVKKHVMKLMAENDLELFKGRFKRAMINHVSHYSRLNVIEITEGF